MATASTKMRPSWTKGPLTLNLDGNTAEGTRNGSIITHNTIVLMSKRVLDALQETELSLAGGDDAQARAQETMDSLGWQLGRLDENDFAYIIAFPEEFPLIYDLCVFPPIDRDACLSATLDNDELQALLREVRDVEIEAYREAVILLRNHAWKIHQSVMAVASMNYPQELAIGDIRSSRKVLDTEINECAARVASAVSRLCADSGKSA